MSYVSDQFSVLSRLFTIIVKKFPINSGSIFGSVSKSSCSKRCLARFKTKPRQL